jgi:GGDEF domain-containing protein
MLLTVGYLVGKNWTTTRYQRRLIDQLLAEETITRAQRLDPITQFHHPDVCRDILLRLANYSSRLRSPLSLVELTIPNLFKLSLDPATRPVGEELVRQIRRLSRPIDALLRWSPDSFLLVFPEVTRQELPGISFRFRTQLERWVQTHVDSDLPEFQLRGVTSDNLGVSGDILQEVRRLLENGQLGAAAQPEAGHSWSRREKGVSLALEFQVTGVDQGGQSFQECVRTERVAADRIWFPLKKHLPANSDLTIASQDGSFLEAATVTHLLDRGDEQLVEAQFAKIPENWVLREA